MTEEDREEALRLIRELAAPAATAVYIDGPVCGVCEHDLSGHYFESGHTADCLVMRARAFLQRLKKGKARSRR